MTVLAAEDTEKAREKKREETRKELTATCAQILTKKPSDFGVFRLSPPHEPVEPAGWRFVSAEFHISMSFMDQYCHCFPAAHLQSLSLDRPTRPPSAGPGRTRTSS